MLAETCRVDCLEHPCCCKRVRCTFIVAVINFIVGHMCAMDICLYAHLGHVLRVVTTWVEDGCGF